MNFELHTTDCLEFMRGMKNDSIDMVLTSPPYNNMRTYINGGDFSNYFLCQVIMELYRVLKPGGVCVWVVGDTVKNGSEELTPFKQAIFAKETVGFCSHDTMIFHRERIPGERVRYEQHFEFMFVWSKGKPKTINRIKIPCKKAGEKCLSRTIRKKDGNTKKITSKTVYNEYKALGNVWSYPSGFMKTTKHKFAYKHPAIFPDQLAIDHIFSWSNPGDIILDPFSGSGTTVEAALKLGRIGIGIDKNHEYNVIAEQRIKNIEYQLKQGDIFY